MKHIVGIAIKLFLITTVLLSIFAVVSDGFIDEMLFLSVVLLVLSYAIGDLFIVPRYGNVAGTIADFGLSFAVILLFGFLFLNISFIYLIAAFSSAFLIAVGEAFFHFYVQQVLTDERKDIYEEPKIVNNQLNTSLQTEFAEEDNIQDITKADNKSK